MRFFEERLVADPLAVLVVEKIGNPSLQPVRGQVRQPEELLAIVDLPGDKLGGRVNGRYDLHSGVMVIAVTIARKVLSQDPACLSSVGEDTPMTKIRVAPARPRKGLECCAD